jgi:aminoglycoside 6'-N-acetyltransferase I
MHIETPTAGDPKWLALRVRLWPDETRAGHLRGMAEAILRGHFVRLAIGDDGSATGFVEASKRVDYVNGTDSSPVAFLEGLYVEPAARRKGVARILVTSVETWATAQGCSELASIRHWRTRELTRCTLPLVLLKPGAWCISAGDSVVPNLTVNRTRRFMP